VCRWHECEAPTGSLIICLSGGAEVAGAQWREGPEQESAGQVGQSLIFSNVSNYDRRLRNPKEHPGSITVPRVGVYR
jgi:hypothetical protein